MWLHFRFQKRLPFGEHVAVCGSIEQLGNWDPHSLNTLRLRWTANDVWRGSVKVPYQMNFIPTRIQYKYLICRETGTGTDPVYWEAGENRVLDFEDLDFPQGKNSVELRDVWQETPGCRDYIVSSSAFANVLLRRFSDSTNKLVPIQDLTHYSDRESRGIIVCFEISHWCVKPGDHLVICGSIPQLGSWQIGQAPSLVFQNSDPHQDLQSTDAASSSSSAPSSGVTALPEFKWKFNTFVRFDQLPFEYKFAVVPSLSNFQSRLIDSSSETSSIARWETGPNRVFDLDTDVGGISSLPSGLQLPTSPTSISAASPTVTTPRGSQKGMSDLFFVVQQCHPFQDPLLSESLEFRGTGIAVPVFSLRSGKPFKEDTLHQYCDKLISAASSPFGAGNEQVPQDDEYQSGYGSIGVGEFLDLVPFVHFTRQSGCNLIQVLPINDTNVEGNWHDSYPYSSLSVFALHPIYVNLPNVLYILARNLLSSKPAGEFKSFVSIKKYINTSIYSSPSFVDQLLTRIQTAKTQFDALPTVDFEGVLEAKMDILSDLFFSTTEAHYFWLNCPGFIQFERKNKHWLKEYAVFCTLRDEYKKLKMAELRSVPSSELNVENGEDSGDKRRFKFIQANFNEWPAHLQDARRANVDELYYNNKQCRFHSFIQFLLSEQLSYVSRYACSRGIILKGDLPIGVSPYSVDTFFHPELFNLDTQTGAPPDYFSRIGQNWGFPTYDWEEKGISEWWQARCTELDTYFQAIRIDHVLGFFRIWEIPTTGVTGLTGHFVPSIPIWKSELDERGIWDIDTLCEPFVTRSLLWQKLVENNDGKYNADSPNKEDILNKLVAVYFDPSQHDHIFGSSEQVLRFKPEYKSEKAIVEAVPEDIALQNTLLSLVTNVVLYRSKTAPYNEFYPRFEFFKECPTFWLNPKIHNEWRNPLVELHNSYFYRRQENLWGQVGYKRLSMLKHFSKMLILAEDLGMVPECVGPVLHDLGILGLRIQRMPKAVTLEFDKPWQYPYLTVCTPSCHDTSTTRGWWEEDHGRSRRYFHSILGFTDPECPFFCEAWIVQRIVEQHLRSRSMWAVFPLQDLFAMNSETRYGGNPQDERINVPANRYHYWRYRSHLSVEDLLESRPANELASLLKHMIQQAGRGTLYK